MDPIMLHEAQTFHKEIVFDGIGAGLAIVEFGDKH